MPLTNLDFCEQAGYLAKNCADWAAGALILRDRIAEPMREEPLRRFCAYVRDRLDALEARAGLRTRWLHKKRQSIHSIVGTATAQCATRPIQEGDLVEVYRGEEGALWVRRAEEFHDGRFERLDEP